MDCNGTDLKKQDEITAAPVEEIPAEINRPSYDYTSAAKWLFISERKLHRLVEERLLDCVKIETEVRFRQADLDAYVLRCVRPALIPLSTEGALVPPGVGTF